MHTICQFPFDSLLDNQADPQNHKMLMHMTEGLTCLDRQECGTRRQASCKVNGISEFVDESPWAQQQLQ